MKKLINVGMLLVLCMVLLTMCKNPEIDYDAFFVTQETIKPETHKVAFFGECDSHGVQGMKLSIGLDEHLVNAESYPMDVDNNSFSIIVDNLNPNTLYYYRYVIEFGDNNNLMTDVGVFTTLSDLPVVKTLPIEATAFTQTSAVCWGRIIDEGLSPIVQRGIRLGVTPTPDTDGAVFSTDADENDFCVIIDNLSPGTTYYYCAYAVNNEGVGYGDIIEFKTLQ